MLKIGIFGGSGYGGAELLRLLLAHPHVQIAMVTANEHVGKPISEVHRNLYGLTDLNFSSAPEDLAELAQLDCLFLALPHGYAMEIVPRLPNSVKVIDLSGDFRVSDPSEFKLYYGFEHTAMQIQSEFVYGLTETNREAIAGARLVANPGCFATATLLGLAPLVSMNLLNGRIVVDAKTGSSGSGAKAAANTHHPQRMTSFYAYKPFSHQHVPEIDQSLRAIGDWSSDMVFMTHSLPVARGIFATIYVETRDELKQKDVRQLFEDFYQESYFVRLVDGSPDITWVKTTNFCDIGFAVRGRQLIVFSALDNLVKGAAGQAVQNMNLMFGLDEKTGMMQMGTNP
jgi:N-acetyl-gamma-glutamyl-phosphate reductase